MAKIVDPLGMVYKLAAYASALGLNPEDYTLLLECVAVGLGTLESWLAVNLLLGTERRRTSRLVALFMTVFTLVTVWIYLFDPVSDCGCFGEALKLTNGETLAKNVLLLACAFTLLPLARMSGRLITGRNAWITSSFTAVYAIVLSLYTLHYLPIVDFTPYNKGVDLRAAVSGDAVDEKSIALASAFYLYDEKRSEDLTLSVAEDTGYTFLLCVPTTERADDGCCDRLNDLYDFARDKGVNFLMATASDEKGGEDWRDRTGAAYPIVKADESALKAMVRSNPGVLLLHDGVIVDKWSNNNLPILDDERVTIESLVKDETVIPPLRLAFWYFIPLLLFVLADRLWIGQKFYRHHISIKHFKVKRIMRKKIVAGNWKMNKNLQEGVALAKELNEALAADKPNCDVVICTPFIHLASVADVIDNKVIGLGAENCADKVSGAYTGEVSAEMVKSTGAEYVILGHSERRAYYHETPEILKEKVNLALENNLGVIFCIGEVLEEREAGKQNEVVKAQLEGSLFDLTAEQFAHIILAYEPVWAIGTGKTATADQAEEMHAFIRQTIAEKFGEEAAENVSILYGGSCKPSNAKEIFSKVNVDGGLIGGAALKVVDFKGIIDAWKA